MRLLAGGERSLLAVVDNVGARDVALAQDELDDRLIRFQVLCVCVSGGSKVRGVRRTLLAETSWAASAPGQAGTGVKAEGRPRRDCAPATSTLRASFDVCGPLRCRCSSPPEVGCCMSSPPALPARAASLLCLAASRLRCRRSVAGAGRPPVVAAGRPQALSLFRSFETRFQRVLALIGFVTNASCGGKQAARRRHGNVSDLRLICSASGKAASVPILKNLARSCEHSR